ncbi:TlpA disulfide reductase family protein [Halomonas sp. 328]|uniref:TlpA disulfide reductase family protein n=1 Tax=Halomonas sp. 328 TaxID=2776704 RepID=UPI0018A78D74|nr:TlpA disulfide reductase family protein [Halomonas sp. 328]MBF8223102.1 TlpA family protein disulfide reductase [Halomonas sp. 328]
MRPSPEWQVSQWLNGPPLSLAGLRGRVVLLHAFQMLCPGCVLHGLPQTQRVARLLAGTPLTVVGLHTVFEHHAVMGPEALAVFLAEHGYGFPVGIDAAGPTGDPLPRTMRAYGLEGTPSTLLFDARGRLRYRHFGVEEDLRLGAQLGLLLQEAETS